MRGSVRGVPRRSQPRGAAGEGAPESRPPRSPHPYPGPGAARTHLAVELADRHDPRGPGRARTPWPAGGPRSCPGGGGSRLLAAPAALSPRPARLAPSSRAAREFLGSFLSSPTCPAGFLEAPRPARSRPARPLLPRRRRRSGGRAGGAGGRGRGRAAPLPAQVWEAAREEEGGRASQAAAGAPPPPPPPLSPAGAGPAAPPAPRAAPGSSRPGAGPRDERTPSAPCWTPGARGTGARRLPTPASRRPLSAQTALWEAGRGPIGDQRKRGGSTREGRRGMKRRDACGRKAPYIFLWVLHGH